MLFPQVLGNKGILSQIGNSALSKKQREMFVGGMSLIIIKNR